MQQKQTWQTLGFSWKVGDTNIIGESDSDSATLPVSDVSELSEAQSESDHSTLDRLHVHVIAVNSAFNPDGHAWSQHARTNEHNIESSPKKGDAFYH